MYGGSSTPAPSAPQDENAERTGLFSEIGNFGREIGAAIGAPTVQKAVDDAQKSKQDVLNKLSDAIVQAKAQGKDTTRMMDVYTKMSGEKSTQTSDILPQINDTPGKVLGNAFGTATDIIGAGEIGGLASGAKGVSAAENTGKLIKPAVETAEEAIAKKSAWKALPMADKAKTVAMDTLKMLPTTLPLGYASDVSGAYAHGDTGGKNWLPGAGTIGSAIIPAAFGAIKLARAGGGSAISEVTRLMRANNPSPELVNDEVGRLKGAWQDFFNSKKGTMKAVDLAQKYGKDPADVLATHGAVPDIVDGKLDTKGIQTDLNNKIGSLAEARQGSLDRIGQAFPNKGMTIDEIHSAAMKAVKGSTSGLESGDIENAINKTVKNLENRYGDKISLGDLNKELISANKMTSAWDRPQFDKDAYSVIGDVFRTGIDKNVDDPIMKQTNAEIGKLISARNMAAKVHGDVVKYGKMSSWMARLVGSIVGKDAVHGLPMVGPLLGAMGGDTFMKFLQNGAFGGETAKKILQGLGQNPEALDKLMASEPEIIQKQLKDMIAHTLPARTATSRAGAVQSIIEGGKPIELPSSMAEGNAREAQIQSSKASINAPTSKKVEQLLQLESPKAIPMGGETREGYRVSPSGEKTVPLSEGPFSQKAEPFKPAPAPVTEKPTPDIQFGPKAPKSKIPSIKYGTNPEVYTPYIESLLKKGKK